MNLNEAYRIKTWDDVRDANISLDTARHNMLDLAKRTVALDKLLNTAQTAGWDGPGKDKHLEVFIADQFDAIAKLRYVARMADAVIHENENGDGDTAELALVALKNALEALP